MVSWLGLLCQPGCLRWVLGSRFGAGYLLRRIRFGLDLRRKRSRNDRGLVGGAGFGLLCHLGFLWRVGCSIFCAVGSGRLRYTDEADDSGSGVVDRVSAWFRALNEKSLVGLLQRFCAVAGGRLRSTEAADRDAY